MDSTEKLIIETLEKLRHFLQRDGGDVEFDSFKDGIVYVKMSGACEGCAFAGADIKELVEVIIMEEVPGVTEVRLVGQEEANESFLNELTAEPVVQEENKDSTEDK